MWEIAGRRVSRPLIVYSAQIALIYAVVITAIYNLTVSHCQSDQRLWVALLASCVGYIMPAPAIAAATVATPLRHKDGQ